MNYQRAMIETYNAAVSANSLMYLYWSGTDWFISNNYEKNWLFRAYPGGRKELSQAGKDMLDKVEKRTAAIESLKEICRDIGCSKMYPSLCDDAPHKCEIIKKLVAPNLS